MNDKKTEPGIGVPGSSWIPIVETPASASNISNPFVLRNDKEEMNAGFLKLNRSDKALWLLKKYPNAFLLLTLIAYRARRHDKHPDGLKNGMAYIGDYKECGLKTEGQYVYAKKVLLRLKIISIVETCRKHIENATTSTTTQGTLVKLLDTDIYDINSEDNNDLNNDLTTTLQRRTRSKERKNPSVVKASEVETNDVKVCEGSSERLHRNRACELSFSFESGKFEGMSDADHASWKLAYPEINIAQEIAKASEWVKSNPTKQKKAWRRFLTGWFSRENERKYNKKPFIAEGKDRRLRDKSQNVANKACDEVF